MTDTATNTPMINVQGVPVPGSQIDPNNFFRYTRRQHGLMATSVSSFAGLGEQDSLQLKQAGILAAIEIKFEGTLTVTPGTGTVATTSLWPYNLIRALTLSANGQSNLINANGLFLKTREFISNPSLSDRGVPQAIGGASPGTTVYQGTLSQNSESWGVGQNVTAIPSGTYDVTLTWQVPVAWDLMKLFGALFLQTSATSVDLNINWASQADLFALTGDAAIALSGGFSSEGVVFSIPLVGGAPVIPDLTTFHAFVQTNLANGVGETTNTPVLAGQGVGKQLMRIIGQVMTGSSAPGAPLAMNKTNYGQIGWGYGLSEQPEIWPDGNSMRSSFERAYDVDPGDTQGLFAIDFAKHWSFRDAVNEADATQLQLVLQILGGLGTTTTLKYAQEVMIAGSAAA